MLTGFEEKCAVTLAAEFKVIRALLELRGLMLAKLPTKAVYEIKSYQNSRFIDRGTVFVNRDNKWIASDKRINLAIQQALGITI